MITALANHVLFALNWKPAQPFDMTLTMSLSAARLSFSNKEIRFYTDSLNFIEIRGFLPPSYNGFSFMIKIWRSQQENVILLEAI